MLLEMDTKKMFQLFTHIHENIGNLLSINAKYC